MLTNPRKRAITKNTVVWLLAAVLFHSPGASANCACRDETAQGDCCASKRQPTSEAEQSRGCCARRAAKQHTRSCCNARKGHPEKPAEACQCGASCACSRESAPAPPVVPPTSRNTLAGELALVLADSLALSASGVESPRNTSYRYGGENASATSLERCIALSRFTL